jgi:hypothetical protein
MPMTQQLTKQQFAEGRRRFIEAAIDELGPGVVLAAEQLGVTAAAWSHWKYTALSVEAAVTIAEAMEIPYEDALKWATRRMGTRGPGSGSRHAVARAAKKTRRANEARR